MFHQHLRLGPGDKDVRRNLELKSVKFLRPAYVLQRLPAHSPSEVFANALKFVRGGFVFGMRINECPVASDNQAGQRQCIPPGIGDSGFVENFLSGFDDLRDRRHYGFKARVATKAGIYRSSGRFGSFQ